MTKVKIIETTWVEEGSSILCIAETLDDVPTETAFSLNAESFGLSHPLSPKALHELQRICNLLPGKFINVENQEV